MFRIMMILLTFASHSLWALPTSENDVLCQLLPSTSMDFVVTTPKTAIASLESKNEKQFWNLIRTVQTVFQPVMKSQHMQIEFDADWESQEQNAFASHVGDRHWLHLYGGLFRLPKMTLDDYLLVLCHEMGHHLAGAPYHPFAEDLSTEGQADYYATNVCMPLALREWDNKAYIQKLAVPIQMKTKCDRAWGAQSEDSAICQRSLMAGLSLANVLSNLLGDGEVSFFTPSKEEPSATVQGYPTFQCRLDTFVAGALCRRQLHSTEKVGSPDNCSFHQFLQAKGTRPGCWFVRSQVE